MQIICFEDERVGQLAPITYARPAYAIGCASFRLIEWLKRLPGTVVGVVREHLQGIQSLDFGIESQPELGVGDSGGILLVNARLIPTPELPGQLKRLAEREQSAVVLDPVDHSILAARVTAADLSEVAGSSATVAAWASSLSQSPQLTRLEDESLGAFRWPHDVVAAHMKLMESAMQWRCENGSYRQTEDGVFVAEDVRVAPHVVFDTSSGPIVLESGVRIGPFSFLDGPIHVDRRTKIVEHSAIKDAVALGHTVKVGGEVEATIIEPFSNKQHHGFLGHSYLGSWINIGAGTCNSDLKNTYGKINMNYGPTRVATGMQFMGCVIGDYSKTAINTSIFTGKTIGFGSMLYGFVAENVPSFVNYARLFGQSSIQPAEVVISTQQRMFGRRNVEQREVDVQLVKDVFALTDSERRSASFQLI